MSDLDAKKDAEKNADEIPAFRISAKKVDDSWKEEARREREAAAKATVSAKSTKSSDPAQSKTASSKTVSAQTHADATPSTSGTASDTIHADEAKPEEKTLSAAEQQQSKIFMNFLAGLAQQALMQMGEIENPYTGQRELDLNSARYTLELLAVVQLRTKGNLIGDETQLLEETLAELKMRYVQLAQEMQRQMAAQMAKGAGGAAGAIPGAVPGPGFGRRK
jgi:hypothetical protein